MPLQPLNTGPNYVPDIIGREAVFLRHGPHVVQAATTVNTTIIANHNIPHQWWEGVQLAAKFLLHWHFLLGEVGILEGILL